LKSIEGIILGYKERFLLSSFRNVLKKGDFAGELWRYRQRLTKLLFMPFFLLFSGIFTSKKRGEFGILTGNFAIWI
jgi:hypothetical protein